MLMRAGILARATWSLVLGLVNVPSSAVFAEDLAHWPCTTGLLVQW